MLSTPKNHFPGTFMLSLKRVSQAFWITLTALVIVVTIGRPAHVIAQGKASGDTKTQPQAVATADLILPVWPNDPPTWNAPDQPEVDTTTDKSNKIAGRGLIRLTNVSTPELHVFRPHTDPTNTTVLIAPGGGYSILAWDLEGTEIATWLQSLGVTAIVLKYRVPTGREPQKWLAAVQDLQRSISLIRANEIAGITTDRVGVLGFSAGGNASARVATATERMYEAEDESDTQHFVPDFAVLIYPAWLVKQGTDLIEDLTVTSETPPVFMAHAANDPVTCMSSVGLFAALQTKTVPAELHVFKSGGHGFGGRETGEPTDAWKALCRTWMHSHDWLSR
ncbi:alpha/beta hydrolase [bacterium]|nr:alpha/beta hydrolase [Rubripirellula sp.]MDB4506129.1 alpha/beta hydrolase [bacterium]MDB4645125.1 alpha/beta hydrolase [Rubripirellula sp.]MDB4770585.1 alpha/beta hydrolase [bacterium]